MFLRVSLELFIARPRSSMALAMLCIALGFLSIIDLVPLSPNRWYFPDHEWFLAAMSWVPAAFFAYCALKGMKSRSCPPLRSSGTPQRRDVP